MSYCKFWAVDNRVKLLAITGFFTDAIYCMSACDKKQPTTDAFHPKKSNAVSAFSNFQEKIESSSILSSYSSTES